MADRSSAIINLPVAPLNETLTEEPLAYSPYRIDPGDSIIAVDTIVVTIKSSGGIQTVVSI